VAVATSLLAKVGDRNRKSLQLMLLQQQGDPNVDNSVLWAATGSRCIWLKVVEMLEASLVAALTTPFLSPSTTLCQHASMGTAAMNS
jgi:hypothetical protein